MGHKKHILVVDDSGVMLSTIKECYCAKACGLSVKIPAKREDRRRGRCILRKTESKIGNMAKRKGDGSIPSPLSLSVLLDHKTSESVDFVFLAKFKFRCDVFVFGYVCLLD